MSQVNIHIAKARLSELIQQAILGEEVIITRDNKPIVKLVPINPPKRRRKIGFAEGLVTIAADFDAPLKDFDAYTIERLW